MPDSGNLDETVSGVRDGDLTALLARVEAAEGPDRELDFALLKGLALIPAEARWKEPEEDSALFTMPSWISGNWELPAYRAEWDAHRKAVRAIIQSRCTTEEYERWDAENPWPHEKIDWKSSPPEGSVQPLSRSLDAALTLVERMAPDALWRVGSFDGRFSARIAHYGPSGRATLLVNTYGKTPALALLAALLRALIAQAADTSARNVPAREGSANASPSPPVAMRHGSDPNAEPSGKED